MASFGTLSADLTLNITDFATKMKQVGRQVKSFAASIEGNIASPLQQVNKNTDAWKDNMKSVSRVVSGIMISQTFYTAARSIREAVSAVSELASELEYAKVAYSNLFQDVSLANEFTNVLQDFAAQSPFSFTESEKAAKRLLAYGIKSQNVMYVMQGVLSAASIQGDPTKVEAISRAFGQIYSYGRLMTQEVRQLAEAGIPAYEILQEELGLSADQLKNLGKQAIPASVAINALVDGIQKRFGAASQASVRTMEGIISNLKDNASMLFVGLFEPFTKFKKAALAALGDFIFKLRELYELKGIGGVFEYLIPPELQSTVRQFIANIGNLLKAILRLAGAIAGLLKPAFVAFMQVFNAFSPIFTTIINILAAVIKAITSNAKAMKILTASLAFAASMWVLFKIKALAALLYSGIIKLVYGLGNAIIILGQALIWCVHNPFWALLIGLTATIVGLSVGFGKLSNTISSFFKGLTKFNGIDPDKILLPSQKERASDLGKFNEKLSDTADGMEDLADSTGKATKAAHGLLSFDEVFKLNEPDEGTDKGLQSFNFGDFDLGDIGDIGESFMPEVPDFGSYFDDFSFDFLGKLKEAWDSIKEKAAGIISTALGALFGGLMGALLGGKLGGIIGALVGALVGYFWNKLADHFGLTPDQKARAGIIGGIGTGLGAILGFLIGGPLGAKIGAIIGALVGSFWGIFAEHFGITPPQHIATLIGGAVSGLFAGGFSLAGSLIEGLIPTWTNGVFSGFSRMAEFSFKGALSGALKQGAIGAIVGLGTGILANAITGWIAQELDLTEQDLERSGVGQTIGSIIGSVVGAIVGGPVGSLVGGSLGQLAGAIVGEFWAYLSDTLKGTVIGGAAGLPIGAIVGTIVGAIGGPIGAAAGGAIGAGLGTAIGAIVEHWEPISEFFSGAGESIATGLDNIFIKFGSFSDGVSGVGDKLAPIKEWFANLIPDDIDFTGFTDIFGAIGTFFDDIGKGAGTVFSDLFSGISTVITDIWTAVTTVFTDIGSAIGTVWTDVSMGISTVLGDIWSAVSTVFGTIFETISNVWFLIYDFVVLGIQKAFEAISGAWQVVYDTVVLGVQRGWEFISPIIEAIVTGIKNAWEIIKNTFLAIVDVIVGTVKPVIDFLVQAFIKAKETLLTALDNIKAAVGPFITKIIDFFKNLYAKIKEIVTNLYTTIKDKFTNIYTSVRDTVVKIYTKVRDKFVDIYTTVKDKITGMYSTVKDGVKNIYNTFKGWISDLWDNVFGKFFGWINDGIEKLRTFFGLESRSKASSTYSNPNMTGHATGGIFNREHVARFAEGNKAEAVIPLENASAMQPFVDAVANGLTASLAPIVANLSGSNQLQPLYVGTLIADDNGLKELERRMEVIRIHESRR